MELSNIKYYEKPDTRMHWLPENTVVIEQRNLLVFAEKICTDNTCRYPQLALRILIHAISRLEAGGRLYLSARHLAKALNVHYDTVLKCLKYLRSIEVLRIER